MSRCRLSRIASAVDDMNNLQQRWFGFERERERATHRSDGFICTVFSQETNQYSRTRWYQGARVDAPSDHRWRVTYPMSTRIKMRRPRVHWNSGCRGAALYHRVLKTLFGLFPMIQL